MWMAILSSIEKNEDRAVTTALLRDRKPNGKEKVKEPGPPCSPGQRWRILPADAGVLCSLVGVQEYKEMTPARDSDDKLPGLFPPLRLADYISHPRTRLPDLTWSKPPPVKDGMGGGGKRAAPRGQENS